MWNKLTKTAERFAFRGLAALRPPDPSAPPTPPRTIVILSCTGIGDALFDSAAIRCLKLGHPGACVVVLAHHRRMTVARHNPYADEVMPYSKSPLARWRLLRALRKRHPDLVVALRVNEDAVALGYLLNRHAFFGATNRCRASSFLLSHPVDTAGGMHAVEETMQVALHAGGAADAPHAMIYQVTPAEREKAAQRFAPWFGLPYIVWQAGGGRTLRHRDWPPRRIIEAASLLRQKVPHRMVITGGGDNKEAALEIAAGCPGAINLCCQTTLEETAAVVEGAAVLVSSDTGVMHLGFATGTPTLALLHPKSKPQHFGPPRGDDRFEVIHLPPVNGDGSQATMDDLSAPRVVEAILGRLARVDRVSG